MPQIPFTSNSQSLYNEGLLQIQRLHYLWIQANEKSRAANFQSWRWTLDTIWRELSRDVIKQGNKKVKPADVMAAQEKNEWFKIHEQLDQSINAAHALMIKDKRTGLMAEYAALSKMEIFLRTLQDSVGKGGKYKDPGEDDLT